MNTEFMKTAKKRMRLMRISQDVMSNRLGVSRMTLYKYLNGKSQIKANHLFVMCDTLGLSPMSYWDQLKTETKPESTWVS